MAVLWRVHRGREKTPKRVPSGREWSSSEASKRWFVSSDAAVGSIKAAGMHGSFELGATIAGALSMHSRIPLTLLLFFVLSSCLRPTGPEGGMMPGTYEPSRTEPVGVSQAIPPVATLGPQVTPFPHFAITETPPLSATAPLPKGRMLFYRPTPGGKEALCLMDGMRIRLLTDGTFHVSFAVPSPRGDRVAFAADRDTPAFNIYLIDTDGSDLRKLTNFGGGALWPRWSPDGTRIAFAAGIGVRHQHSGQFDIFVVDVATGILTNLTNTDCCDEIGPAWSPDGKKIAFMGGWGVALMNADGTDRRDLVPSSMAMTHFSTPSWSPDGHWIGGDWMPDPYYRGDWKIFLLTPDGSTFLSL